MHLRYMVFLATMALLCALCALARDGNEHRVTIQDRIQVGSTQLVPGNYRVEWQGTAPQVQVSFLLHGKTVATAPGTLRTNVGEVIHDAVVVTNVNSNTKALEEIDFGRQKEVLIFVQGGM